jgi:hypothetical protein
MSLALTTECLACSAREEHARLHVQDIHHRVHGARDPFICIVEFYVFSEVHFVVGEAVFRFPQSPAMLAYSLLF